MLRHQEPRSEAHTAPHQKNPVTKKKTPHSNADTHRTPTQTQSRTLHSKHPTSAVIIKFTLPDRHSSRLRSTKGYKMLGSLILSPLLFFLKAGMGNTASSEPVQNNIQGLVIEESDIMTRVPGTPLPLPLQQHRPSSFTMRRIYHSVMTCPSNRTTYTLINHGFSFVTTSPSPCQQIYSIIELECMAIQWAVKKWGYYLCGLPTAHW